MRAPLQARGALTATSSTPGLMLGALVAAAALALAAAAPARADHGLLGKPQCSDGIDNDGDGGTDFDGGLLGLLPPDPDCEDGDDDHEGIQPTCALCVDFVTTHDPPGPGEPRTRMHRNIAANVPYALDLDGAMAPALALPVSGLLGYELRVNVQGLDADRPTVRIGKLVGAPPILPARIEVLTGGGQKRSFGYDTLESTAPSSFVADIDLSDRDGDPATTQARVEMEIDGAGERLTMLTEEFTGNPVSGRSDRKVQRLELIGDQDRGTRVPAAATVDLTSTDLDGDGAKDDRQLVELTRSHRTTLGFELREPGGSSTVGTVDELPPSATVELSSEDRSEDGEDDVSVVYEGDADVAHAEVTTDDANGGRMDASVDGVPAGKLELTVASSTEPDETEITYGADGRVGAARVRRVSPAPAESEDGPSVLSAELENLPTEISELRHTAVDDGGTLVYHADAGVDRAAVSLRKTDFELDVELDEGGPTDVDELVYRTFEDPDDGVTINYTASDSVPRVDARLLQGGDGDSPREITAEVEDLPSVIEMLQFFATDGEIEVIYDTNATTTWAHVHGTGLDGLPGRATEADLTLERIPSFLGFEARTSETVETTRVPHTGPPPDKCDQHPDLCDPRPECFEEDPPPDCEFAADVTETTTTTDITAGTLGGERLGLAEIQLTSGPDDRLPDEAGNGRPQDGVLLRDLADRYVAFARVSELENFVLSQEAFTKESVGVIGPGALPFETDAMHIELDSKADKHALGLDLREREAAQFRGTEALLELLPDHVELDLTNAAGRGTTDRGTIDYSASEASPDGFSFEETVQDAGGEQEITKRASLDPMPRTLHVCQEDFTGCSEGAFDENIENLASGVFDEYKCVGFSCDERLPISADEASEGSILIAAAPATHLVFEEPATNDSGDFTSLNFDHLRRFGLQAHKTEFSCRQDLQTCQRGYVAMDSGGFELSGELEQEADGELTRFDFPSDWFSIRHVWGFHQTFDTPPLGEVAIIGPINCPDGTVLEAGGETITERFCDGDLREGVG